MDSIKKLDLDSIKKFDLDLELNKIDSDIFENLGVKYKHNLDEDIKHAAVKSRIKQTKYYKRIAIVALIIYVIGLILSSFEILDLDFDPKSKQIIKWIGLSCSTIGVIINLLLFSMINKQLKRVYIEN